MALALGALGPGCTAQPNHPPEVSDGPRPLPQVVVPGGEVRMQFEVTDPDGDNMVYSWTQTPPEPAGHFSDPHARNPTWTAPEVGVSTEFIIQVTVSDDEGGGVLGTAPTVRVEVQ